MSGHKHFWILVFFHVSQPILYQVLSALSIKYILNTITSHLFQWHNCGLGLYHISLGHCRSHIAARVDFLKHKSDYATSFYWLPVGMTIIFQCLAMAKETSLLALRPHLIPFFLSFPDTNHIGLFYTPQCTWLYSLLGLLHLLFSLFGISPLPLTHSTLSHGFSLGISRLNSNANFSERTSLRSQPKWNFLSSLPPLTFCLIALFHLLHGT